MKDIAKSLKFIEPHSELDQSTYYKLNDKLWDYIQKRLITPHLNKYNNNIEGYHLTQKGKRFIEKKNTD